MKAKTIILRILAVLGSTLLVLVIGLYSVLCVINYGPSPKAHKLFVNSVRETSALKFLANWFTSEGELEQLIAENNISEIDDTTDVNLIHTDKNKSKVTPPANNPDITGGAAEITQGATDITGEAEPTSAVSEFDVNVNDPDISEEFENVTLSENGITICEVSGSTYTGRVMIIDDPSRVKVGICNNFGNSDAHGMRVDQILKKYNAIAGTNAGGFYDPNGRGSGSVPEGFVFSEGKLMYDGGEDMLIGFDNNDVLHVGRMTSAKAKEKGIRDAITFGPALIVNGTPAKVSGVGGGLNPRTAIGQRADGKVLLMTIDGRQANSLGATFADMIKIFQNFGAVNAANLDGGSSTIMYYNGSVVSNPSNLINNRYVPTAIIVTQ